MMENYVNLHNHSTFSMMDSVASIEDLVNTAVSKGQKALALTDHGVFGAIPKFQSYYVFP